MIKLKKITVADIAKEAGVSPGTVSNALNNRKGSISKEKRDHIIQVAENLGYFKKGKRTGIITLVIYSNKERVVGDTPFFSELIRGLENETTKQDYRLNIVYIDSEQVEEIKQLDDVSERDGLILLGTEMQLEDVSQFENFKIPYVIIDNAYTNQKCDFVSINNRDGMYEITNYLVSKGYKRIGLINSINQINNFKERKMGYLQAMMDNGLNVIPELEAFVQPTIDDSYRDFKDYLNELLNGEEELPEAFAAVNDYIALGAMRAMQELNIDIPLTGFDDISFANYSTPSLTTVRVNKRFLGEVAIRRLLEKFSEDGSALKIMVGTEIVERNSTK